MNGLEIAYYPNKKISSEINYLNGELSGSYKTNYFNGNVKEVGQCLEGYYSGLWKLYYSDGTLQSEYTYNKGRTG